MLRSALAAALSLGLASSSLANPANIADPTVLITIKDVGTCTGFVAETNFGDMIITAGHCAEDANGGLVTATDNLGNVYGVDLAYFDKLHDVSIWSAPSTKPASTDFTLACHATVNVGDEVSMTGYPLDFGRVTVNGKIAAEPSPWSGWPSVYRVAMFAAPGNSGSAVTNSKGEVIGILVGGDPHWPGMSMVVPIKYACSSEVVS